MILRAFVILFILLQTAHAGQRPYWVFLEPDENMKQVKLTPRGEQRLLRRGKSTPPGNNAVSPAQIQQLRDLGYPIRRSSRWLNAVSITIGDPLQISQIRSLPFVKDLAPVASFPKKRTTTEIYPQVIHRSADGLYGQSATQNEMLDIPQIHTLGYDGSNVLIGVFDTGFLLDHPVFASMNVVAQYDFIDGEVNASGPGEDHGINVLSVLGGYVPDQLVGPAYNANYLLARTEDYNSESRAEEDNWVAALEWADSLGVDVINSSLNYFQDFDDPGEDYPFSALDGQTTICAQAANIAAQRGILIVNAAGNEGPGTSSLWPPADSPHVLAVGSVNSQGDISYFSGRGPTYDGRTKPDVVAQGSLVYMATGTSRYAFGNGTSFSAPQIAGLAALVLQAHPTLAPDSMISLFRIYGDNQPSPDNTFGWGIPTMTSLFSQRIVSSATNCLVYPNPVSSEYLRMILPTPVDQIDPQGHLYNIKGQQVASLELVQENETTIVAHLPRGMNVANQLFVMSVTSGNKTFSGKFIYLR